MTDFNDKAREEYVSLIFQKNELLKEMVMKVIPIANSDPLGKVSSAMYRIARNTLRRNCMRVQAVSVLITYEKMSDSALEIARDAVEDAISLSYILSAANPEQKAEEFFEFRWIQLKQDMDYYSKIPDYEGSDLTLTKPLINREFERVKLEFPQFLNHEGQPRHSWDSQGVEGMMKILVKKKIYNREDRRNIMRTYNLGSRKTHFNPLDILNFHDQGVWDKASLKSMDIALKGVAASFTSLLVRYYDTVSHYDSRLKNQKLIDEMYDLLEKINT